MFITYWKETEVNRKLFYGLCHVSCLNILNAKILCKLNILRWKDKVQWGCPNPQNSEQYVRGGNFIFVLMAFYQVKFLFKLEAITS